MIGSGDQPSGVIDVPSGRIGRRIRELRRERSLTLVRLAALAGLSHPFLSQVERGQARPSMVSLERIATALGTTQLELMAAASDSFAARATSAPVTVLRAEEGVHGPYSAGEARLLASLDRPFHPVEFAGSNADPGEYYLHQEDEFLYVISGSIHLDLGARGLYRLAAGDSVYYEGGTSHRWSTADPGGYRVLTVKESPATRLARMQAKGQAE